MRSVQRRPSFAWCNHVQRAYVARSLGQAAHTNSIHQFELFLVWRKDDRSPIKSVTSVEKSRWQERPVGQVLVSEVADIVELDGKSPVQTVSRSSCRTR